MFTLIGTLTLMLLWSCLRIPWLAQEVAASQKDPVPWVCGIAVNYNGVSLRKDLELDFFVYIYIYIYIFSSGILTEPEYISPI